MSSPFPDAAISLYMAQQQRLARLHRSLTGRWRLMGHDFDSSWRYVGPLVVADVTQAQTGAAQDAITAGTAIMASSPSGITTAGRVDPYAFSGAASDGRDLASLLYSSVVQARSLPQGVDLAARLQAGFDTLEMHATTQVADATRQAAGVLTAASRHYQYQRLVAPGCCKRCAVLAGKEFRWNQGFLRHPRCRCIHVAIDDKRRGYTNDIDPSQVRDLTKAQRRAISDGADMNQVINADRGRSRNGMTTTEGTTRRGYYAHVRQGRQARLTPEAIYRTADNRDDAIRMLADNGYLDLGTRRDVARYATRSVLL